MTVDLDRFPGTDPEAISSPFTTLSTAGSRSNRGFSTVCVGGGRRGLW